jgi:hypothetical protein
VTDTTLDDRPGRYRAMAQSRRSAGADLCRAGRNP